MIRLFVGINISQQPKLIELSTLLRNKLPKSHVNWVPPQNYHLTLKFLGEVEPYYINSISLLLDSVANQHKFFKLAYNKLGYFGNSKQPKVIMFDFKPNEKLNLLQKSIDIALKELGFENEIKKYYPHLTIGRVKKLYESDIFNSLLSLHQNFDDQIEVNSFQLIESILKPEGPVYKTLKEFKLITELL